MIELLQFIMQDGWHFAGTVALIYFTGEALEGVVRAARQPRREADE